MTPFKRNLVLGYSFSLILLLGGSIAALISINGLLRNTREVERTNLVIAKLGQAMSSLKDAETGQRGYLLTGDEIFLDPFRGALQTVHKDIEELRVLTKDNQLQQLSLIKFTDVVQNRMTALAHLIEIKRRGIQPTRLQLLEGKRNMDNARDLVAQMTLREKQNLASRVKDANSFAEKTPMLIMIASLLAVIITIFSFLRVNADFTQRQALQYQLMQKDKEISERINTISSFAETVSTGDYSVRMDENRADRLGQLAVSLNAMTASLDHSFQLLTNREWLQTGISTLSETVLGEQTSESIAEVIIEKVVDYSAADVAAFYLVNDGKLEFARGYGFVPTEDQRILVAGQGIAGHAYASGKIGILKNVDSKIDVDFTLGKINPREVLAIPFRLEKEVKAVLVVGSVSGFFNREKEYLQAVANHLAVVINTAQTRAMLGELLSETQSQSEELTAQHGELESINRELEAQSQRLRASEEELKSQQEELLQSNSELEERSRLLEERNMLIAEQNFDIKHQAEQLEISSRYKSEFLANMSHELRTPLNSILLLSRLLADNAGKNLNPEQVEYARVIQGAGHGLLSLIDEILDLSKIESGKMDVEYSEVLLSEIMSDMRALFDPLSVEKKIAFTVEVSDDVPLTVETDQQRVEQVLKNLLANAFKFTSEGSVSLKVDLRGADKLAFAITDTGIGIAKDKQDFIFEAFRQEDGSTRRNYGGTGLGLSISRDLASLLGGELTVASEQGQGSSFTFVVPLKKPTLKTANEPAPNPIQQFSRRNETIQAASKIIATVKDDRDNLQPGDKFILVIEDDVLFAEILLDYSRKAGYKGIVATKGDDGVELARQFHPLGVLLDIYLPVMDGWAVLKALKDDPKTRHIPVHVMSSVGLKRKSITAGAVDFTDKPIGESGMEELFRKIGDAISQASKKVMIVEENPMHARALAAFLRDNNIPAEICHGIGDSVDALRTAERGAVILDTSGIAGFEFARLQEIKSTAGLESLPIIVFTGKSLSLRDESDIKKYAESIVVKSAQSYRRMLDEVSIFLHLVDPTRNNTSRARVLPDVLEGKKILVVDDDVRNIYSLTKSMEHYGVQVITAMDGKDATKQLQAHPGIQLVLMDMMMPEMDGYDATRYIRNMAGYEHLPVIAVTAKAMSGDREKCIEAGASDYITKPVDTDQLISLLRVWLSADV